MNVVPDRSVRWTAFAFTAALVAAFLFAGVSPALADDADSPFKLYGFVRVDAAFDDSPVNHNQCIMWALSEDPRVGARNDAHLEIYPRVTRFGFRSDGQMLSDDVRLSGRIELDFQNGGSESRPTPRMRLAYLEISRGAWAARLGQDWDMISPLYPAIHTDGALWNAGNLGDRHTQLRGTWTSTHADASVAFGPTGVIDMQDLDKDGERDGAASALPYASVRIGVTADTWVEKESARVGVWGWWSTEETRTAIAGHDEFETWVAGFDASIPVAARVRVEGEGWMGANLSDLRGGIGQGVNVLTGEEIESTGGWAQMSVRLHPKFTTYVGASIDDPRDGDLPSLDDLTPATLSSAGRTRNRVAFVSNFYRPWKPFQVGIEYYYFVTEYKGLDDGTDNRVNVHFDYIF